MATVKDPAQAALEKFRTRWRRWLGNKTRWDQPHYVTLLDSNWIGWMSRVLSDHGHPYHGLTFTASREEVKAAYRRAIDCATMQELTRLDGLYAAELFDARFK